MVKTYLKENEYFFVSFPFNIIQLQFICYYYVIIKKILLCYYSIIIIIITLNLSIL